MSSPPALRAAQPTARPIARHGEISRQTSPKSSDANGTPTQKATNTAVGARLSACTSVPATPAHAVKAQKNTPSRPSSTSTTRGSRNSARSGKCSSRGRVQPAASATNDATSTAAAATPNSSDGMGRSARPTIPCAKTTTVSGVYERRRPRRDGADARRRGALRRSRALRSVLGGQRRRGGDAVVDELPVGLEGVLVLDAADGRDQPMLAGPAAKRGLQAHEAVEVG